MNVYAMELVGVEDVSAIRKLMRPQVLERSRAADNRAARYRRSWFEIKRIRRTKRFKLVVEVAAKDIEQATERAGMLLRRSKRDDQEWRYWGAYGGFSLALAKGKA